MKEANDKSKSPYLKQIILSSCCAVLSLVVLAVATAAWFARNDRVKATNVNIKVDPEASLVIKDINADENAWDVSVSYETVTTPPLTPVTHAGSGSYLLQYCSNPIEIRKDTGYNNSGDATLANVPGSYDDTTKRTYFKDFTVQIASLNKEFTGQKLTVSMELTLPADSSSTDARYSASVDVWTSRNGTPQTYLKTLHPTQVTNLPIGDHVNTFSIALTDNIIPKTNTPLEFTLRCYFDGALQIPNSDPKTAYVNTAALTLENVGVTVTFAAENAD